MEVFVECICGKKFNVDRTQVEHFDCEGCGRHIDVPTAALDAKLKQIREQIKRGSPGMRDGVRAAAKLRNFHAVPILKTGAESGVREAVNAALVGLLDYKPGQDVLTEWIRTGAMSISRLTNACTEEGYEQGVEFVCRLISGGQAKESHVAEVAPWLGKSGSQRALETLREARRKYPNLGGILDSAMSDLRDLDDRAGGIPDEAKVIPGRPREEPLPEKKGCMGLLLALVGALGMLAAVIAVMS